MSTRLVLGIGNILLRDEGVGVRVIEAMQQMPLPDDVELIDGGTAGADLVDLLADRPKVIVVDAIQGDATPGTILRMTAEDLLPEPGECISLHQLGLVQSLLIARRLGCAPREVVIFGIQPSQIAPGLELTPAVAAAVPTAIRLVLAELSAAA
jgi:hydrogenase maturation protease